LKRIGISPDGGEPNCIGGTLGAAGAVVAGAAGEAIGVADPDGDAIGVAAPEGDAIGVADPDGEAIGVADGDAAGVAADGDGAGVACATTLYPMFPRVAGADGAATAVSPMLAIARAPRTPVLSRFNIASLNVGFAETGHPYCLMRKSAFGLQAV